MKIFEFTSFHVKDQFEWFLQSIWSSRKVCVQPSVND